MSDDAAPRARSLQLRGLVGVLDPVRDMATRHLPGKHNQESHGNDVGVDVIPGDKLKLAGRVDLLPGERLLSSDKVTGDNGRAYVAVTEKDGKRSIRLGLGNEAFGTSGDDSGPWRAGPDQTAEANAERHEKIIRLNDVEDELERLEGDPNADAAEVARLRALSDELDEATTEEPIVPLGHTAMLDEAQAERLISTLDDALANGEALQVGFDEREERIDELERERDKLRKIVDRVFTDEEDALWDRLTAEIEAIEAQEPPRPAQGFWTLAEGSVPGEWADVHYKVYFDDPSVGIETKIGAVPHGSDMDFDDLRDAEMAASFDWPKAARLVRMLDELSGDQPKSSENGRSLRHTPDSYDEEFGVHEDNEDRSAETFVAVKPRRSGRKSRPERPRSRTLGLCTRAFDFELDGPGDGRTLEGYAAVFDSPARIRDLQGDFDEVIRPGAFTRSLQRRMPVLQWDHGKDPSVGTAPIGDIEEVREDGHGLYVRARLYDHPSTERVRLAIKGRSVRGMSFRFGVPKGGDKWSSRSGDVDLREVGEADTYELGPVPFPAYDVTSVSVRSILSGLDAAEMRELVHELSAYLRDAVDLTDLTGRPSARRAGGGDIGRGLRPALTMSARFAADGDSLRLRGIL